MKPDATPAAAQGRQPLAASPAASPADSALARDLAVDRISDRYEAAWRSGERPQLAAFLADMPGSDSGRLFRELLAIEVAYRRDLGETVGAEEYLSTHPQFADEIVAVVSAGGPEGDATQRRATPDSQFDPQPLEHDPHAPPAESPPAPATIGKYRVIAHIGSGGQAEVYRVIHPTLQHELVLKLAAHCATHGLDAALLETEGKLLAGLEHPNMARVYDLGYDNGRPYLVMEYLRGCNLRQQARQRGPSWRQSAAWTAKLARAVAAAHAVGVTHRDIKPDNVVLDAAGEPRLIDFGLAVVCDAWGETPLEPGVVAGSACFMAPEQARGEHAAIGPASDIFALGALLYYLLTGAAPFQSVSHAGALELAAACEFDKSGLRNSGVPRRLRAVCLKAMAADPQLRHRSAEELAATLESCIAARRHRLRIAVAAALAAAGVFGIAAAIRGPWRTESPPDVASSPTPQARTHPVWDKDAGELRVDGRLARRVKRIKLATNIVPILDSFEATGWPPDIASPFTDVHAGRRLKDAVASLNEGLSGMRFYASADEARVCWRASRAETQ